MSEVNVKIGDDLIKPIIEAKVQAAIVDAMGDFNGIVNQMVSKVLTMKVNSDGKVDQYSSCNNTPFIEFHCRSVIHKAVRSAIEKWVESKQDAIEAAVEKEMTRRTGGLAKQFVAGLVEATKSSWQMKMDVHFNSSRD